MWYISQEDVMWGYMPKIMSTGFDCYIHTHVRVRIRTQTLMYAGTSGAMDIVGWNGHSDSSSNPRRDCLHFT